MDKQLFPLIEVASEKGSSATVNGENKEKSQKTNEEFKTIAKKKQCKKKKAPGTRCTNKKSTSLLPTSVQSVYPRSDSLCQASHLFALGRVFPKLSRHFGRELLSVRDKSQIRLSPDIKKYLCSKKQCGSFLSIDSASIGTRGECILECPRCHSRRVILQPKKKEVNNHV